MRLRRITERPGEEEDEGEVQLVGNGNGKVPDGKVPDCKVPDGKEPDGKVPDGKEPDGKCEALASTLTPEAKVKSEVEYKEVGGSDFTGVTVEAWTSFNR